MKRVCGLGGIAGLALASGCTLLYPRDDLTRDLDATSSFDGGEGRSDASVERDAASSRDAASLGLTCPAGMILVATSTIPFCIDAREATTSEYLAFLKVGNPGTQPPECSFNADFQPKDGKHGVGGDCAGFDVLAQDDDIAMSCVGWCDAEAYCQNADKRLCAGGDDSEWYAACSAGGTLAYPYGDALVSGRCVDTGTLARASARTCEGPSPGLFDMSGNVFEWEGSCPSSGGATKDDVCQARGGAFASSASELRCDGTRGAGIPRSGSFKNVGIRCCRNAIPR